MVFVLDTTGSMGGLIEGAKQRIWGIVNEVMKSPQRPRVKIGLVAYRDKGDDYVTQVLPLNEDLDKVYATLMEYRANGGGDGPENVRRALKDGVQKAGWSTQSRDTAQILFLVGDAPPHDDYQEEPSCSETVKAAISRGITVNTILCGDDSATRQIWQSLAASGEGQFFAIAQDGGVRVVETPYDKKLAQLGGKMGSTYVAYGFGGAGGGGGRARSEKMKEQAKVEMRFAASAPVAAQADRALNKVLNARNYYGDLLNELESGRLKMKDVKSDQLPAELQKLPAPEKEKMLQKRLEERREIKAEILKLNRQREEFLAKQKPSKSASQASFDAKVVEAVRKQAGRRGIRF
jgi:uncharacterized protein YegL